MIKIFDEATALKLKVEGGFSYTQERLNKKRKLFCFEDTLELRKMLSENFAGCEFIDENILRFG